jgi:membrane protease YdiL (CAAX protease family)
MTTWLRPMPEARPYQQLGRTDLHRWWRPIVSVVVAVVVSVVAGVMLLLVVMVLAWQATGHLPTLGTGEEIFRNNDLASLIVMLGTIAILLPAVWLVTVLIERRGIGTLSSVAGRIRWRWLGWCFLPAAAYMLAVIGGGSLADLLGDGPPDHGGDWVGWARFWPSLLVIVLLVPFQAAAEEYIFRGWLLQAIGSFTFEGRTGAVGRRLARVFRTPWPAILVTSGLFAAGHGYSGWGPVDIASFGVLTGLVVVLTGGLEAGIALHIVNNIVSMSLDASEGDLSLHQGSVSFLSLVEDTLPMLVWALLIVWMFRHTGSRRPMKRLS